MGPIVRRVEDARHYQREEGEEEEVASVEVEVASGM